MERGGEGGLGGDKAQEGDGGSGLIDPFVLDLNGDGVHFIAPDASQAYFDLTGNGFATRNAWISAEDGILTIDVNGDGQVEKTLKKPQTNGADR
jgi:hypothetical protein